MSEHIFCQIEALSAPVKLLGSVVAAAAGITLTAYGFHRDRWDDGFARTLPTVFMILGGGLIAAAGATMFWPGFCPFVAWRG